jgi:hypothetical protein
VLLQNMNQAPAVVYGPTPAPPGYSFTAADKVDFRRDNRPNIFELNQQPSMLQTGGQGRPGGMDKLSQQVKEAQEQHAMLQHQLDQLVEKPQNRYNQNNFVTPGDNIGQSHNGFVTPRINLGQSLDSFVTPSINLRQHHTNFVTPRTPYVQAVQSLNAQNYEKQNYVQPVQQHNSFEHSLFNIGNDHSQSIMKHQGSFSSVGGTGFSAKTPDFANSYRRDYPRSLNFPIPMNFEDMMNTGLSLAKQSQKHRSDRARAQPRASPTNPPKQTWKPQKSHKSNHLKPGSSHGLPPGPVRTSKNNRRPPEFSPSKPLSSSSRDPKRGGRLDGHKKDVSVNIVETDQIHIIGPNCYVMTESGFKLVGPAAGCRAGPGGRGPASIWDSLTSLPLVTSLARSLGVA